MAGQHRSGLTMIEVAVVIIILLVLLALLIPSMQRSHCDEGGHACMNNQKQLTLALLNFEARSGKFPGYANRVGPADPKKRLVASWVVSILPFLDRQDVYQEWERGIPTSPYMPLFVCISDSARSDFKSPSLSYVVNCGLPGDKDDTPATGVFHNHNVDGKPVTVSLDYISQHDGSSNTLLLSENLQAGLWTDTDEANVGMVWWRDPPECSRINECKDVGPRQQDIKYARPSSNHGSVFVVSFCDGHQQFLSEDIDYLTYQRLMAVDDEKAGLPVNIIEDPIDGWGH
jgi:hypothetical protein